MIYKRKAYSQLDYWKNKISNKKNLLVYGTYGVGKSFCVNEFVKKYFKSYIFFDFENLPFNVEKLLNEFRNGISKLCLELENIYKVNLLNNEDEIILIFDEFEVSNKNSNRLFNKELINLLLTNIKCKAIFITSYLEKDININKLSRLFSYKFDKKIDKVALLNIDTFDFEEFLSFYNDKKTIPLLKEHFKSKTSLGYEVNLEILIQFKNYFLLGGYPFLYEYIKDYFTLNDTDEKKREYIFNVEKLALNESFCKNSSSFYKKMNEVFESVPLQLCKRSKIFNFDVFSSGTNLNKYIEAFDYLNNCMYISKSYNLIGCNADVINVSKNTFKCFLNDTGLLVTSSYLELPFFKNMYYFRTYLDTCVMNSFLIENTIYNILKKKGYNPFFYYRSKSKPNEEEIYVNFIIVKDNKLVPILICEDKLSKWQVYSINSFIDEYKDKAKIDRPIVFYSKDLKQKDGFDYYPFYMAMFL